MAQAPSEPKEDPVCLNIFRHVSSLPDFAKKIGFLPTPLDPQDITEEEVDDPTSDTDDTMEVEEHMSLYDSFCSCGT